MAVPRVEASPWANPRRRAEGLRERHAFVAEVLDLYVALLRVWETSWAAAREDRVRPEELPGWAARRVLPDVVAVTAEAGPEPLVECLFPNPVRDLDAAAGLLAAWLAGEELVPVERYLARATLRGPLEALDAGAACAADPAPRGGRRCPTCGGPPQLSFRTDTGDSLVSGQRRLLCARCGDAWNFTGNACAYCGEAGGGRRTIYAERQDGPKVGRGEPGDALLPHLRAEGCSTCRRFLIDIDLGRDPKAVPEVDELAALPLALYAAEQGLTKITPNVMGM